MVLMERHFLILILRIPPITHVGIAMLGVGLIEVLQHLLHHCLLL